MADNRANVSVNVIAEDNTKPGLDKVRKSLSSLITKYFNVFAVAQFGKEIAKTTGYFEQQQVALEGILHSATAARKSIESLQKMALESPFQTQELITYTKQLAAYGIEQEKLLGTTKELADISAGLGVSMDRLILAYGQVKAASVLRGQELRQFTEAGIPLVEELAKKFSELNGRVVTTGEVFGLISKRQVSFQMVADVLADLTKEGGKFYEMQERLTETTYGQIQKLKDVWTLTLNDIGKSASPVINRIIKGLQEIVKNIGSIMTVVTFTVIGKTIAEVVTQFNKLTHAIKVAARATRIFGAASRGVWGAVGFAIGAVIGVIVKMVNESKKLQRRMDEIATSVNKDTQRMIDGLDILASKITKAKVGTKEYNDAVRTLAQNYGDFIGLDVIKVLEGQDQAARDAADGFRDLADGVKDAIQSFNEYKTLEQQQESAKTMYGEALAKSFGSWKVPMTERLWSLFQRDFTARYGYAGSQQDIQGALRGVYTRSMSQYAEGNDYSKEELSRILGEAIRKQFPSLTEDDVNKMVQAGVAVAFSKGQKERQKAIDLEVDMSYSDYGKMTKYFNAVSKESIIDTGDAIAYQNNVAANYVKALHETLKDKFIEPLPEELENALKSAYKVVENGKVIADKFDNSTIHQISTLFEEFRQTFSGDPNTLNWLRQVKGIFSGNVSELSGNAQLIADLMDKNGKYNSLVLNSELRASWLGYRPSAVSDYDTNRGKIKADYDKTVAALKTYKNKNQSKDLAEVKMLEEKLEMLKLLASPEYYNVDLSKKTTGKSSSGNFTRFFSDMFSLIKTGFSDQKKLIEETDGVTNALIADIEGLKDDNILKAFYQQGKNPFAPVLDKIKDYDLETIFSASDFAALATRFKTGVGVDKVNLADFEQLWEDLLGVVRNKAISLRAQKREKDASKVEAYLQTMVAEGVKFFGRDEIQRKIDEALVSLTRIEAYSQMNADMYRDFKDIAEATNYLTAWNAMYPGTQYSDRNEAVEAQKTLSQMLGISAGMSSYIGASLSDVLNAERLSISMIPQLYEVINMISMIGEDYQKELQGVKDSFLNAIKELINGIKEETKKLADTRTETEKMTDSMYGPVQTLLDKNKQINAALKAGEINEGTAIGRKTEALQDYVKGLTEILGGSYDSSLAKIFADASSETGSSKAGNIAQLVSSLQNGGFKSMLGTAFGQSVATTGGMTGAGAAGAIAGAGGALAMVDMIIKMVYGAIKGLSEMAKKTLELMQSYDDVTSVTIDEVGVMHVDTVYGDYDFEKANAIIDTVEQFNQHVMDGWEKFKSGDLLGSFAEVYNSYLDLIISIRKIADMKLQRQIEDMQEAASDLDEAASNLSASAERLVGMDKVITNLEATAKSLEQAQLYKNMIEAEAKKKLSDGEQMKEWQKQYMDALNEFLNGIRKLRDEMISSTEDWSSAMSKAIRSAFQNGENAAREFRDTVKTMIGDVIERMLQMSILEPLIENALQAWTNSDYLLSKYTTETVDKNGYKQTTLDTEAYLEELTKNIMNPEKTNKFYHDMLAVGDTLLFTIDSLHQSLSDFYTYNSSLSSLSGGIESKTEDTARRLEALANSQLGETIVIRKSLEQMMIDTTILPSIQAEAVKMNSTLTAMLAMSTSINNAINDMRNGVRPMKVYM